MQVPSLYDFPDVFEVVMRRDEGVLEREVATVRSLLLQHGIDTGHILELACGACAHGIPLAKMGFSVTGVDRSSAMLCAARRRAREAGVSIQTVEDDVVTFAAPGACFDAAIFLYETFEVITSYPALERHFAAVRQSMRDGGLYIIDLSASRHGIGTTQSEWGRRTLYYNDREIETWMESFPGDWVEGTSHLVLHCCFHKDGRDIHTVDEWRLRVYSPWGFSVLVRGLPGWRLASFTSWRGPDSDFRNDNHYFAVLEAVPDQE